MVSFQYSLITSCYKQLGCSHSPRMRYIQLVIELYFPSNYTEGFVPWCSSLQICYSVVNMVVMELVLGQSLMVISTLLLCKSIFPSLCILRFVVVYT